MATNNHSLTIATVVGARPQFIKAGVVSRVLRNTPGIAEVLIHTGQHYDPNMSDVFLRELQLRPDYDLAAGSGLPGEQTARMLERVERVLVERKPDMVLVYGDTNSTLAGALAAVKLHIPVAHVEAGLRCFDLHMPEELNRILTDHCSDLLFAPTTLAVENLLREDIAPSRIFRTGDVMYDAFLNYADTDSNSDVLGNLQIEDDRYILATIHRAENTDQADRLSAIIEGLNEVAREIPVVLPLHPRTRQVLGERRFSKAAGKGLHLITPVGYLEMRALEQHARLIATDSGGVQKEAFFYRVPCVILRTTTEWEELVQLGWSFLVEPASAEAVAATLRGALHCCPRPCDSPYGDGHSCEQIVEVLLDRKDQICRQ